jgi:DNA end-binding protein Ku
MPRAVWSGSLVFGLVTIPVRLVPATEPKDVRFHLTDAQGRRVRYRRFVEAEPEPPWEPDPEGWGAAEPGASPEPRATGPASAEPPATDASERLARAPEEEIAYDDLRRAYAVDDGRLVVLDRDDIEAVRSERSRTIEIEDFVDLAEIDPVYFEKSYHLAPQRGAEKPYALLLRALERTGRVGIGRFVLRTKPHLVAIRPAEGVLGLETLFFGDEVRDGRELVREIAGVEVSDRELDLAAMLIGTLHTTWDPAAYSDTYREELLRRIAEKTPVEASDEPAGAATSGSGSRVEELMEALTASVEAAKRKQNATPTKRARRQTRERTA